MITLAAAVCAATLLVNKSTEKWVPHDMAVLTQSRVRCKEMYPKQPCVVSFTKTEPRVYRAICGAKK